MGLFSSNKTSESKIDDIIFEYLSRLYPLEHKINHIETGVEKCFECIEKLEGASKERATSLNYQSYLALADRIEKLEMNYSIENKVKRIAELEVKVNDIERLIDVKAIEECIFHGAETHASILKCESYLDDLEDHEHRLEELETEINTVRALGSRAYHPKKPHKCPVCDGTGYKTNESINVAARCLPCDGKGIVWG